MSSEYCMLCLSLSLFANDKYIFEIILVSWFPNIEATGLHRALKIYM